ncbi:hypothetical protein [Streptomyces sp. NPDC058086]|uniref:hypothetical protein n=1 Tax=Streptomyces sp. NPDC058086 TaxID=3346334 RepID=UPI0036E9916E
MTQPEPDHAVRTADVYLLFAHEPYYPSLGTREINTTVVTADTLLHPQVQQPDGARIHDLLIRGRQPGEIIPLATPTHELNGSADRPTVGDFEPVTTDMVQLVQTQMCDALSLGLPARASCWIQLTAKPRKSQAPGKRANRAVRPVVSRGSGEGRRWLRKGTPYEVTGLQSTLFVLRQ